MSIAVPNYDALYRGGPYAHAVPFSLVCEIGQGVQSWLMCAELERFVLGSLTAHTSGMIADCERRARELVNAARAKHEEREEKLHAEEAERERQRIYRSAPAPRPAPTPASPPSPPPVDRSLEEERLSTPLNGVILPLD